ncbi:MAG: hypothetical protein KJ573_04705 [Proteobacteria bacterium]|nr:hypothetical protein [Desulfobacterales bacterium]MBL7102668.1 hypothetical protein [Desulfobacteraceae bacterium]MBU0734890.1 hypothetical protein [Pseudomonadota bacterium]MBU1902874.1 hypothetical protein [Pseudomonadota bacterium]
MRKKDNREKQVIEGILDGADVRIDGDRAWDMRVRNPLFYKRVMAGAYCCVRWLQTVGGESLASW